MAGANTSLYKDSPQWAKGTVIVVVVAGLALIAWKAYQIIDEAIKKAKEGKTVNESADELAGLQAQGINPTYTDAQYKIWADAMEECYQGWGTCTGDTVFVNMKNDADILKLIIAFGVRTISSGAWNPEPDLTGDLPKILRSELDADAIDSINKILGRAGIKYRF